MASGPDEEDWYLREWMRHLKKRQVDLSDALGWTPNRTHLLYHGVQPYSRDDVTAVARCLGIRPFELLMRPEDALRLRAFRETAVQIAAAEEGRPFEGAPIESQPKRRSGGGQR
jgi:hypothetical protein